MSTRYRYIEVNGPAPIAAAHLARQNLRIVRVEGSNGCDFKNETAESYIVKVDKADDDESATYNLNWNLLTEYHVGDRQHYLAELRNDAYDHLRHYATESTGLPAFVVPPSIRKALNEATALIDEAIDAHNARKVVA